MLATVRGRYRKGQVQLREPVAAKDGTEVLVIFLDKDTRASVMSADDRRALRIILAERGYDLTADEVVLLDLAKDGLTYDEIGQRVGLTRKTLRNRYSQIFKRLRVTTRAAAVAKAIRAGVIEPTKPGSPPARRSQDAAKKPGKP